MTETELMKDIIEETGASTQDLPDNLTSTLLKRIKESVGGGGSGGVTSWNDLTDKPFDTVEKEDYIIPETTVAMTEGQGLLMSPPAAAWAGSRAYTVNWNGTDYNCTSIEMEDAGITGYILGNMAILDGEDTGEPFLIMGFNEPNDGMGGCYAVCADMTGAESATFSVHGMGQFVETLPEKYLPKTVRALEVPIVANVVDNELVYTCDVPFNVIKSAFTEGIDLKACVRFNGIKSGYFYPMYNNSDPNTQIRFSRTEYNLENGVTPSTGGATVMGVVVTEEYIIMPDNTVIYNKYELFKGSVM